MATIPRNVDPDWHTALELSYQCGIKDLAGLIFRVIKLEKQVAALTERVTQLERKRGQPRGTETRITRIDCGETR